MGAVIMNSAVIGEGSIVAAGALILEKTVIPPLSLVTGIPGKIKKRFSDLEEVAAVINDSVDIYLKKAHVYRSKQFFTLARQ
jgi:carbonic anhydrase/acetyltransferase-like protein (isoleucine patch superfamily)